jgi:hypothetical protein
VPTAMLPTFLKPFDPSPAAHLIVINPVEDSA